MRKLFSLFAALTLSVGLWAETVSYLYPEYIDGDVTKGIDMWQTSSKDATPISSSSSTWGEAGVETWLVVNENVTISERVECLGEVHLILADGAKLTAQKGITVSGEGNSLTIYAQSTGEQMGQLIADATSVESAAGIGGEGYEENGSNITINGGIITATGGEYGAGIGGGESGAGSNITINGGEVTANGGTGGAGIGGGYYGFGSNITINGGEVEATGGERASGIGGGESGSGSNITINGGKITARGSLGAGIGGGFYGEGSHITINGGSVTATGGEYAAGIGGGYKGEGSNITINGGVIMATSGMSAAGIGGGYEGEGSNITINGGVIMATGGTNAAGIGGGSWSDGSSNIFVATSLQVKADGNNPPTTVIAATRTATTDIANDLAGKRYATVETPAGPEVGEQFFDATSGLFFKVTAVGDNNTVKVLPGVYEKSSYIIPASVTFKNVALAVTEIDESAFTGCDALNSITIPASVTTIGEYAFQYRHNLATVTFAEGSQLATIGYEAFYGCEALTSITLPASVTTIGEEAFSNCTGLTSITIPASVTTIGEGAFLYCDALASVTFAEGSQLQTIGAWAFNRCEDLPNITIPASVTEIGEKTFLQCTALTDIYVEAANTHYISEDGVLFDYAKDKLIQYPIGNTRTTYTIPTTVTTIELFSFFNATLISVNIPASVTTIGESAFQECEALTSIDIPASVTEIGEVAFGFNPNLYDVTVHWTDAGNLPEMGEWVFAGIAGPDDNTYLPTFATLHVPAGTKNMYKAAEQWQDFGIIDDPAATNPAIGDKFVDETSGLMFEVTAIGENNTVKVISLSPKYASTSCTIPSSVTYKNVAFVVTEIGGEAFAYTALTFIDIPASVTTIGDYAFVECYALYDVTVHWTDAGNLPEMGEEVFAGIAGPDDDTYLPTFATLHVPAGTKNMYKAAEQWQDFGIIEELAPAVEVYTRVVTEGNWGTICLPWESVALEGGDFYNVLGTKHAEKGVALTPIEAPDQLEAGRPYVFKATSEQIKVTYDPATEVEDEVEGNHIIGSFTDCTVPNGMYIIYNNMLYITDGSSTIGANRAYFDADNMEAYNPATAPARVVFMGGHQTPTELKVRDAQCTMHDGKYLINGQFVIIKDNKMYNAQGIEL